MFKEVVKGIKEAASSILPQSLSRNRGETFTYSYNYNDFVQGALCAEISKIAYDALSIYKPNEETLDSFNSSMQVGVCPLNERRIREISLNVADITIKALSYRNYFQVHKLAVKDESTGKDIIFVYEGELNEDTNTVDVPIGDGLQLQPLQSLYIEPFYSNSQLDGALFAFKRLWHLQQRMEGSDWIASKLVLKKDGANSAFQMLGKGNSAAAMKGFDDFKKDIEQQMNEVWGAEKILLDTRDSIEFLSSNDKNIEYIKMYLQYIYSEIARNLMEPITRVAGVSASGMNATGEGDAENYEMTLQRIRQFIIDPYLKEMGIDMIKVHKRKIDLITQAVNLHSLLGLDPSEELVEVIKEIAL